MKVIEIENLNKTFKVLNRHEGLKGAIKDLFSNDYSLITAVHDLSMSIEEGEIVGYLGPNGAGKSTTIKMMTGVLQPTSGKILVNHNIPYKNRKVNAKNIGVVFGQRTQLWWSLPLIESFRILKEIYQIHDEVFKENLKLFDEIVEISALYSKPVRQMSLGQRTLCDILASFLHNPKVIFLDEPTIGLDISIKSKIRDLIKELNHRRNTTIILTTHDIGDVDALCQRVITIDKGRIIFDDSIDKLKKHFGAYRTIKINIESLSGSIISQISNDIKSHFGSAKSLSIRHTEGNWVEITIDQNETGLLDMLNFVITGYNVRDVMVEDIKTEEIVKSIYEGEFQ